MMHKSANVRCNVHARQWKSHKTSIKGYNARFIFFFLIFYTEKKPQIKPDMMMIFPFD